MTNGWINIYIMFVCVSKKQLFVLHTAEFTSRFTATNAKQGVNNQSSFASLMHQQNLRSNGTNSNW